jgi:hypothetical protein
MNNSDNFGKVNAVMKRAAMATTYLFAVGLAFTLALSAGLRLLEG